MRKTLTRGIIFFSLMSIMPSMLQLVWLSDFYRYKYIFADAFDENVIMLRYCVSWGQRILAIIAGAGLLVHNELSRKALLILAVAMLVTIYWKHQPSESFIRFIYWGFESTGLMSGLQLERMVQSDELQFMAKFQSIFFSCVDIIFQGCLIFYLTRPQVKAKFS